MNSIFDYQDYRKFLRSWVLARPKQGRGEWSRIAKHLGVSSTMISQVMNGERHFSQELASELGDFLGLTEEETSYLFLLIDYQRAGTHQLRAKLKKRVEGEQKRAAQLARRLKKDTEISESTKAVFYSDWVYSGVRNLSSIDAFGDADSIAARLGLSRSQVQKVLEFLLQEGLCKVEDGKIVVGPQRTHIGSDSPWVAQHHRNWRLKGFDSMGEEREKNLFYTGPMSMSEETAAQIRQEIPSFLERIYKLIHPSPSEVVRCLNIDWFEY